VSITRNIGDSSRNKQGDFDPNLLPNPPPAQTAAQIVPPAALASALGVVGTSNQYSTQISRVLEHVGVGASNKDRNAIGDMSSSMSSLTSAITTSAPSMSSAESAAAALEQALLTLMATPTKRTGRAAGGSISGERESGADLFSGDPLGEKTQREKPVVFKAA
jgi:hypothetical protein